MTMTEPDMSKAMTLRSRFQSAFPLFSTKSLTERQEAQGGLSRPWPLVDASPSLTETSLPVRPPPNKPDPQPAAAGLETEDWDLLFRAVLETLARTACGRAPSDGAVSLLQAPGDVLDECLDALEQLRRSARFVQHPLMPKGGASGTSGAT